MPLDLVLGVVGGLVLVWLLMVVVLWQALPADGNVQQALRLATDAVRLTRRLAADQAVSRGVRLRLWLLLAYLVSPIDLVPDFIPVIGYADDVIVVALVVRSVLRTAGSEAIDRNWTGTAEGLQAILRLAGTRRPPV